MSPENFTSGSPQSNQEATSLHLKVRSPKKRSGRQRKKRIASKPRLLRKSEGWYPRWNGVRSRKGGRGGRKAPEVLTTGNGNPCTVCASRNLARLNTCHQEATLGIGSWQAKSRRSLRQGLIDRCRSRATSRVDASQVNHAMEVSDEGQDRPERSLPVDVQGMKGTRAVNIHPSRRRGEQKTTKTHACPAHSSR